MSEHLTSDITKAVTTACEDITKCSSSSDEGSCGSTSSQDTPPRATTFYHLLKGAKWRQRKARNIEKAGKQYTGPLYEAVVEVKHVDERRIKEIRQASPVQEYCKKLRSHQNKKKSLPLVTQQQCMYNAILQGDADESGEFSEDNRRSNVEKKRTLRTRPTTKWQKRTAELPVKSQVNNDEEEGRMKSKKRKGGESNQRQADDNNKHPKRRSLRIAEKISQREKDAVESSQYTSDDEEDFCFYRTRSKVNKRAAFYDTDNTCSSKEEDKIQIKTKKSRLAEANAFYNMNTIDDVDMQILEMLSEAKQKENNTSSMKEKIKKRKSSTATFSPKKTTATVSSKHGTATTVIRTSTNPHTGIVTTTHGKQSTGMSPNQYGDDVDMQIMKMLAEAKQKENNASSMKEKIMKRKSSPKTSTATFSPKKTTATVSSKHSTATTVIRKSTDPHTGIVTATQDKQSTSMSPRQHGACTVTTTPGKQSISMSPRQHGARTVAATRDKQSTSMSSNQHGACAVTTTPGKQSHGMSPRQHGARTVTTTPGKQSHGMSPRQHGACAVTTTPGKQSINMSPRQHGSCAVTTTSGKQSHGMSPRQNGARTVTTTPGKQSHGMSPRQHGACAVTTTPGKQSSGMSPRQHGARTVAATPANGSIETSTIPHNHSTVSMISSTPDKQIIGFSTNQHDTNTITTTPGNRPSIGMSINRDDDNTIIDAMTVRQLSTPTSLPGTSTIVHGTNIAQSIVNDGASTSTSRSYIDQSIVNDGASTSTSRSYIDQSIVNDGASTSTYHQLRRPYHSPPSYTPLSALLPNDCIHDVIAVVHSFSPPLQSSGTDHFMKIYLIDPTSFSTPTELMVFTNQPIKFPEVYNVGDIVRLHRYKSRGHINRVQLTSNRASSVAVFAGLGSDIVCKENARHSHNSITLSLDAIETIKTLRRWVVRNRRVLKPTEFTLLSNIEEGEKYTIIGNVVRKTDDDSVMVFSFYDGTTPPEYISNGQETALSSDSDGQQNVQPPPEWDLRDRLPSNKIVQLTVSGKYSTIAKHIQPGQVVVLHNALVEWNIYHQHWSLVITKSSKEFSALTLVHPMSWFGRKYRLPSHVLNS